MLVPELADYANLGVLALRVAIGIIFIVHGWPKLTQARTMGAGMAQMGGGMSPGVMSAWMLVQGIVEVGGGFLLVAGIATQVVALLFVIIMAGAIGLKNTMMKTGFMAQQTTGWEFDFVLLAACLLLVLIGPGAFAVMPSGGVSIG